MAVKKVAVKAASRKQKIRPVLLCTEYKGVFFGYTTDSTGDNVHLKNAKMTYWWGTTRGLFQLANTGPTSSSKITLPADCEVRKVNLVMEMTPEAVTAWEKA